jgi:hypothetical protein
MIFTAVNIIGPQGVYTAGLNINSTSLSSGTLATVSNPSFTNVLIANTTTTGGGILLQSELATSLAPAGTNYVYDILGQSASYYNAID